VGDSYNRNNFGHGVTPYRSLRLYHGRFVAVNGGSFLSRHARESGHPENIRKSKTKRLDSRLRGNDA
jgi:hypothetical protein